MLWEIEVGIAIRVMWFFGIKIQEWRYNLLRWWACARKRDSEGFLCKTTCLSKGVC